MPGFKFLHLVALLEELEKGGKKDLGRSKGLAPLAIARGITKKWFKDHKREINREGPSALAFLSCLLPHRLPHRTYGLRERRLGTVVAYALYLPEAGSRRARLKFWTSEQDFATLVAEVVGETENLPPPIRSQVTLEEIDAAVLELAAKPGVSGPRTKTSRRDILNPILKRLSSKEVKWLMRMILKCYSPALVPEQTVLREFHFLLPKLLTIQNSFEAALSTLGHEGLNEELVEVPDDPKDSEESKKSEELAKLAQEQTYRLYAKAALVVHPIVGVMIQRQPYHKARSINHCIEMSRNAYTNMSGMVPMQIERKYDGEYCQIHVDLSKAEAERIKIFSKSGKDSTADREGLHRAIEDSLLLDDIKCPIRKNCILEGELLVWNRQKEQIQPFHVIRKYVLHGGRSIGTTKDSPKDKDENLMIMYYDLLYIDDHSLLTKGLIDRRGRLEQLIEQRKGICEIGTATIQNFGANSAQERLFEYFIQAVEERWEGLVLKGIGDPYFSWDKTPTVIKLKPDYIGGLEQPIDLCIVGGFLERSAANEVKLNNLSWTSFYLASFENKAEVEEFNDRPHFRVVDVLHIRNQGISKADILHINQEGRFRIIDRSDFKEHLEISFECKVSTQSMTLFREPFVVEVTGAGFDKPEDATYFTYRFPRVKLHTDRTFLTANSFDELQAMAEDRFAPVSDPLTAEIRSRLERANGRLHPIFNKQSQDSSSLSSLEATTPTTPPGLRTRTGTAEPLELVMGSSSASSACKRADPEDLTFSTRGEKYHEDLLDKESRLSGFGSDSAHTIWTKPEFSGNHAAGSAAQIKRRPRYISDELSDDGAPESSSAVTKRINFTSNHIVSSLPPTAKRPRDISDEPAEELGPESRSSSLKRMKSNDHQSSPTKPEKLKAISPPVVKRYSVDKNLQGLPPSEALTSTYYGNQLIPKQRQPSFSQRPPRFTHTVLNENQSEHRNIAGSNPAVSGLAQGTTATVMPPHSHSPHIDKGKGKDVEPYDEPQDFNPPPLLFEPRGNYFSRGLHQPTAASYDPLPFSPTFYDPPKPSANSFPTHFSHPQMASEYFWRNPIPEFMPPLRPSTFPESYVRTPVQPQTPSNSRQRPLSDPQTGSRAPLTEISNPSDRRNPARSGPGSGQGHLGDYFVDAEGHRENYYPGHLRGGASSPSKLIQSPRRYRLRCTIGNDPCSKEMKSQILAHICRSPSSAAANSIGRILTSHWYIGTRNGMSGSASVCRCACCRLVLIVVVDDTRPREVAKEIKHISSAILSLREQALGETSPTKKRIVETNRSGESDQKLVIFLSRSARPVLSKLEREMKAMQATGTRSGSDRYMTRLSIAFKTYFAGAIHVSFARPFFSLNMARSLFQVSLDELDSLANPGADHFGELYKAVVEPKVAQPVKCSTNLDFPPIYEDPQLKSQCSADIIWKWSQVLKLIDSLSCDAEQA